MAGEMHPVQVVELLVNIKKQSTRLGLDKEFENIRQSANITAKDMGMTYTKLRGMAREGIRDMKAVGNKDVPKINELLPEPQSRREQVLASRFKSPEQYATLARLAKMANKQLMETPRFIGKAGYEVDRWGHMWKGTSRVIEKDFPRAMNIAKNANQKFRGEVLSVMFFGMSMQRLFGGLTKGAMKMAGGTTILGEAINMVMLPAALDWNKVLIPISTNLMDIDDSTKKIIGHFTILAGIFAGLVTAGAMLILGLGGLKIMFAGETWIAGVASVKGIISTIGGASYGALKWIVMLLGRVVGFVWTTLTNGVSKLIGFGWTSLKIVLGKISTVLTTITTGISFVSITQGALLFAGAIGIAVLALEELKALMSLIGKPLEQRLAMDEYQHEARRGGTMTRYDWANRTGESGARGLPMPNIPGEPIILESNINVTTEPLSGLSTEDARELGEIVADEIASKFSFSTQGWDLGEGMN